MTVEADAIASAIGWGDDALRALDRLISRHGANAIAFGVLLGFDDDFVEVEEEAERTDHKIGEDAPISEEAHDNADANTHGGDGNSGECEHAAEKSANDRDGFDSACDAGTIEDTPDCHEHEAAGYDVIDGMPGFSDLSAKAGMPTDRGDCGTDEVTEGMGSRPIDCNSMLADDKPDGTRCPAMGGMESIDGNTREPKASQGDAGAPEADFHSASSGCVVKVSQALAKVSEVARIARALSRLMADATRHEASPLFDGKRVVHELVTRQFRVHRMRRDVPAVKGLLVLYDVSGSCDWIADRTWGIAESLAKRYDGFYAAKTPAIGRDCSEGSLSPSDIVGRNNKRFSKLPPIVGKGHGDDVSGWVLLKAAGISHILVFGDAHGTAGYRAAFEAGIRILWVNPNKNIAPYDKSWCEYALINDGDIAEAVEKLTLRR
jgi:hypothetical protein